MWFHTGLYRGPMAARYTNGAEVRSVRTTFRILEAVADNQPIGLSELARRLDLPKSTVQRSLATLADLGWISAAGSDITRWTLGRRARILGEKVDDQARIRDAAMPSLSELNSETLETIHLTVVEDSTMRLIDRMESRHELRFVRPIGSRAPLHAASSGKAVLAHLPEAEVLAYFENGLQQVTSHTITDRDELTREFKLIRERGYAIADQELADGIVSIAACIRPRGGRPIAALSISGPSFRIGENVRAEYGEKVAAAATAVAERLHV
jgi:IclR family transcriptional regulator, acetate operon repressor